MKHIALVGGTTLALLLIPLAAMQWSSEVSWTKNDFLSAGVLLLLTAIAADRIFYSGMTKQRKVTMISMLAVVFLLVWAQLAVGII